MKTPAHPATQIPEGYRAIPIHGNATESVLRLCVLARTAADPAAGHLVLLRSLPDTLVYLGCVTDVAGSAREWIELWVQNVDGLAGSFAIFRENISNPNLDTRWSRRAEILRSLDAEGFLPTGHESLHPLPSFLDLVNGVVVHPGDAGSESRWELCRDDALLEAADLPAFTKSVFRYLHQPSAGKETRFVPVVAGAPENSATVTLESIFGEKQKPILFNPQGGLMMACSFCPLGLEEYVDLLGGKSWQGIEHGKNRLYVDSAFRPLQDWELAQQSGAFLFMGPQGRAARFVEVFHLKLQLLYEAFRLVRASVASEKTPFLNLSADSFRVRLSKTGSTLPFLWSARTVLAKPGQACALPLKGSDLTYFLRTGAAGTSVYFPEGLGNYVQGTGSVRIRKTLPPQEGGSVLEGTLVTQERLTVSPHDLLSFPLPLPSGRLDLCGHLYSEEGLAQGEARFRTVPQKFSKTVAAALQSAEGVSFARAPFEIVPLLSTPCDLYSLAVLAVRVLLVNDKTTLPQALDEVLSLAREVATEHNAETDLSARIQSIFGRDPRYPASLGPQRLANEPLDPAAAFHRVPPELWWDTLAMLVSQFPQIGPDSNCHDFGDVPPLAMESVFDKPIAALEKLLSQTRSLLFLDWNFNREIQSAIRSQLDRINE